MEITEETEKTQFVNISYGFGEAYLTTISTMSTLAYGANKEMVSNWDIIDCLDVSVSMSLKKRKKLKNINDLYESLCVAWHVHFGDYSMDPSLFCKGIKQRIESSKIQLEKATRKELKRWDVYFFRDEKWNKRGRFSIVFRSAYGLWGIDLKDKMDILLDDVLIVKKRRNPRHNAFYSRKE